MSENLTIHNKAEIDINAAGFGTVRVGDLDLTDLVSSGTITFTAGEITKVTLHLAPDAGARIATEAALLVLRPFVEQTDETLNLTQADLDDLRGKSVAALIDAAERGKAGL